MQRPPWALLCWAMLWWAPFAVSRHTLPCTSFYDEALAAALSSLGVLLTWMPRPTSDQTRPVIDLRPLYGLLVGWGGWALLVLLQPWWMPVVAPEVNRFAAAGMALAVLAMLGGAGSHRWSWSSHLEQGIALTLVIGGLLTVGGQGLQLAGLDDAYGPLIMTMAPDPARRLFGNLGQANHAATYLVWALAGLMYLVQRFDVRPDVRSRAPMIIVLGVMLVLDMGVAFTGSRTPWGQVLLLTGLGLWGLRSPERASTSMTSVPSGTVHRLKREWSRAWFPLMMLPMLVLTGLTVAWANHRWGWHLADPAQRLQGPQVLSPRLALWQSGWTIFRPSPWLGTGWGDYAWRQYQAVLSLGPVEPAQSAHNLVLDLLARTGLLGAGLVLIPLIAWGWRALRSRPSAERTLMLGLVGPLMVHAMVEFPETYLFFLLPMAFLIGRWGVSPATYPMGSRPIGPAETVSGRIIVLRTWSVAGLAGVALIAVLGVIAGYWQAEQALEGSHIPVPGAIRSPEIHGLGRLFAPWLDALSWPARLSQDPRAALQPGFDAHLAHTWALAPRVDHLRDVVIALARAGRNDAAWDAAQRWALFSQGDRRWSQERARAVGMVTSNPHNPGLQALGRRLKALPVDRPFRGDGVRGRS